MNDTYMWLYYTGLNRIEHKFWWSFISALWKLMFIVARENINKTTEPDAQV